MNDIEIMEFVLSCCSWAQAGQGLVRNQITFEASRINKAEFWSTALWVSAGFNPVTLIATWDGLV